MIDSSASTLFSPRQLVTDPAALITYEVDAGFAGRKPV